MMLYLTGATSSAVSSEITQDDPMRSLGGYISSSPVPNGALNTLFDLISLKTIKDRVKETICIGLVNKFDYPVKDISAKIVSDKYNVGSFRLAAVEADDKLCVEHINNRYSEPMTAEFYDATFYRASVEVEILNPGVIGEETVFDPFDVTAVYSKDEIEGTWEAINKAFSKSETYSAKRLTERRFKIERRDAESVGEPLECSFITTEGANFSFLSKFSNEKDGEVFISETLNPNKAIGLWIQREITDIIERSNEEIIEDYNENRRLDTVEEVELVINYSIDDINGE